MDSLDRLHNLERQVDLLRLEIEHLKRQMESEKNTEEAAAMIKGTVISQVKDGVSRNNAAVKSQITEAVNQDRIVGRTIEKLEQPPYNKVYHEKRGDTGIENKIGKNIMGILASLLIFIGLLLFVSLIYQNLTETMKMAGVYLISTVIVAAGLFAYRKKKNAFTMSLLGCGMGAYYISLLLTRFYFHRMNDYAMYVLIALWLACVYLLSRRYSSPMFAVIGQLGIFMAVVSGIITMGLRGGSNALLGFPFLPFLVYYYVITTTIFWYLLDKKTHKYALIAMAACNLFTTFLLTLSIGFHTQSYGHAINLVILTPCVILSLHLLHLYTVYLRRFTNELAEAAQTCLGFVAFIVVYVSLLLISINLFPERNSYKHIACLILLILLWVTVEWLSKCKWNRILTILLCNLLMLLHDSILINNSDYWMEATMVFGLFFWYVPVLAVGWVKNSRFYKGLGMYLLVCNLFLMHTYSESWILSGILPLVVTILFLYGVFLKREEAYHCSYKIIGYFITLFYICLLTGKIMDRVLPLGADTGMWASFVTFLVIAGVNGTALAFGFDADWSGDGSREKVTNAVLRLVNTALWIAGMDLMHRMKPGVGIHVLLIAITSAICCVGVKEAVKKWRDEKWLGFYIGIKFTLYLIVVLKSFQTDYGFLTSLLCIGTAVICILVGFRVRAQSFRLYGLLLTMVSTAKLVLVDVHYDDSMGRVVSFLLCGILCFGINLMYHSISKKVEGYE